MRHAVRFALVLPLLASLVACSASNPSTDTPATETPAFQVTVAPGTPVFVNRGGQWVPATVVKQTGVQNVLIHYEGMPAEWDEDVVFERVRSRPGPAAGTPGAAGYRAGEVVLVRSQNRLFVAEVTRQVDAQTYGVHYAGYGPEAVENVTQDRIQRPFTGASAYGVGSPVLVDAGAPQPLAGKVIAVVAADQWIVRLDGLGAQYDQHVGADKIRPFTAAPAPTATTPPAPTATTPPAPTATTPPATTGTGTAGKPPVAAPPAPAPLKVGDAVLVKMKSVYYPAKITAAGAAAGSWKVRIDGQPSDDEVAGANVVRFNDPLKNVKYRDGQAVFVEWHGVYAPGKVIKEVAAGSYKVRIDGASPDADEIVVVKRLRPR